MKNRNYLLSIYNKNTYLWITMITIRLNTANTTVLCCYFTTIERWAPASIDVSNCNLALHSTSLHLSIATSVTDYDRSCILNCPWFRGSRAICRISSHIRVVVAWECRCPRPYVRSRSRYRTSLPVCVERTAQSHYVTACPSCLACRVRATHWNCCSPGLTARSASSNCDAETASGVSPGSRRYPCPPGLASAAPRSWAPASATAANPMVWGKGDADRALRRVAVRSNGG